MIRPSSIFAVALSRIGVVVLSPLYQNTVSVVVASRRPVAVSKGGPSTRCGGVAESYSKNSVAARWALAPFSEVCARISTSRASADWKFAAVALASAPTRNSPSFGVPVVIAFSVRVSFVPSGRLKEMLIVCPSVGSGAANCTDRACGAPAMPAVTLARSVDTASNLRPKGGALSSVTVTVSPAGTGICSRPRLSEPRSAWARSETICLKPARPTSPFMTVS